MLRRLAMVLLDCLKDGPRFVLLQETKLSYKTDSIAAAIIDSLTQGVYTLDAMPTRGYAGVGALARKGVSSRYIVGDQGLRLQSVKEGRDNESRGSERLRNERRERIDQFDSCLRNGAARLKADAAQEGHSTFLAGDFNALTKFTAREISPATLGWARPSTTAEESDYFLP
jgi:hypothetical protein